MTTTTAEIPATIETFLLVNAREIPAPSRAKLREAAAKSILDEKTPIADAHCPPHLRDVFRRLVVEAAYRHRNAGEKFTVKINQSWI